MDAVIKKIPYGMTDFERIILENYYYVDKTQYIAKVEKVTSFFFFVRPRRFGKSLFLNMLGLYYDINQKDKFEKIFGNLYIGKHPTPDRNKYLVLTLNFSSVAANMDRLEETFNTYCKIVMDGFLWIMPRGFKDKPDRDNRFLSGCFFRLLTSLDRVKKEWVETAELLDFTGV